MELRGAKTCPQQVRAPFSYEILRVPGSALLLQGHG